MTADAKTLTWQAARGGWQYRYGNYGAACHRQGPSNKGDRKTANANRKEPRITQWSSKH